MRTIATTVILSNTTTPDAPTVSQALIDLYDEVPAAVAKKANWLAETSQPDGGTSSSRAEWDINNARHTITPCGDTLLLTVALPATIVIAWKTADDIARELRDIRHAQREHRDWYNWQQRQLQNL